MKGSASAPSSKTSSSNILRAAAPPWLVLALALAYLILHLPSLAPSLEDYDSLNFGLALYDYDIGKNQPHPPGYPVYIAAGRAALAIVRAASPGIDSIRADGMALSGLSAVAGAIALAGAWWLFALLNGMGRSATTGTESIAAGSSASTPKPARSSRTCPRATRCPNTAR